MGSKRDRQGVRTPAQLEQKYSFGSDQKAVMEMRQLNASLLQTTASVRSQMAAMVLELTAMKSELTDMEKKLAALGQEFILAELVSTNGTLSLNGKTYTDLKSLWDAGRCIVIYSNQSDGSRRYYYCMGLSVRNAVTGLLFQYSSGTTVQCVFLGSDGNITAESIRLTATEGA